jgi:hypothetical protein
MSVFFFIVADKTSFLIRLALIALSILGVGALMLAYMIFMISRNQY